MVRNGTWIALSEPRRRAILALLRQRPHAVGELSAALDLTQPSTSKHLKVLREAGLVRVTQDAQRRMYSVDAAPLVELDAWLAPYRTLWNDSLDALGQHLDAQHLDTRHLDTQHIDKQPEEP